MRAHTYTHTHIHGGFSHVSTDVTIARKLTVIYETSIGSIPYVAKKKKRKKKFFRRVNPFDLSHGIV